MLWPDIWVESYEESHFCLSENLPLRVSLLDQQKWVQSQRRQGWIWHWHKKPNCRLSGKLISLKFCLGMRIGNQTKFMSINIQASSLHSLIADGIYRPTSLGRIYWKTMIGSQASLQTNCNREGFNAACERPDTTTNVRARIGILGNGQNDCVTCDSRIGFGMQGIPDDKNTCGNAARVGDNGQKYIKTFGYILVQWNRNNVILPVKNTY